MYHKECKIIYCHLFLYLLSNSNDNAQRNIVKTHIECDKKNSNIFSEKICKILQCRVKIDFKITFYNQYYNKNHEKSIYIEFNEIRFFCKTLSIKSISNSNSLHL